MRKKFVCSFCESEDLEFEASAKWDNSKQAFEFSINDFYYKEENVALCRGCGCLMRFKEMYLKNKSEESYKLYKITVEKEFVVASRAALSVEDVENSIKNIMTIHCDSMRSEDPTHILAQEIKSAGDLPHGWETACLPYTNYQHSCVPKELVNKTIKEYLEDGTN